MIALLVVLSALVIYYDATKHKIGKVPGDKRFNNLAAGAWAICTLLLWIVAVPVYLVFRQSLIERAKTCPQEPAKRGLVFAVLSLLAAVVAVAALVNLYDTQPMMEAESAVGLKTHQEKSVDEVVHAQHPAIEETNIDRANTSDPGPTASSQTNRLTPAAYANELQRNWRHEGACFELLTTMLRFSNTGEPDEIQFRRIDAIFDKAYDMGCIYE